jgi:glycosyltransferase involved in cell wall biosynthesis
MWGTRFEFAASRLARTVTLGALRQRSADVLHFHTQGIAWQSLDLMRRIPTLISADMTAIQSAEQETLADWRWTHRPRAILEGRAFRSASAVVAFSRWAARSIQDVHGVDQHRIFVIHPGIRRSEFQAFHSRDQVETVDECRVLFVGGEFERKGGPLLVDVFLKHLVATGAKLDIVTKSPVVFDHPQIRVHRNIAPFSDAWRRLYAKASLLVVPTFRDASSHASIEAMAAGLPVVTTRIGGIPEIVVEGDNGFLIEPGDGALLTQRILALIGDRPLRVRMGAAGKGRVEKYFDAEKNASYLASLYARIYSERRSTVVVEERDINKAYAQD